MMFYTTVLECCPWNGMRRRKHARHSNQQSKQPTVPPKNATLKVKSTNDARLLVQFYNGMQYTEIFTLGAYMVRRFEGPDATEKRVGQMAGLLAAASTFAMAMAAWPWGRISDRIGRKPVVMLGNLWTACCILLFCSAKVYWIALVARFIAGIFDGSLVMTKVMVGESCRPKMQGRVMSYLSLGDAVGTIVGPMLGGLLADPCDKFFIRDTFLCSANSLLVQRPFLLPGIVTAALGFITSLINIFFMDETLASKRPDRRKDYSRISNSDETQETKTQNHEQLDRQHLAGGHEEEEEDRPLLVHDSAQATPVDSVIPIDSVIEMQTLEQRRQDSQELESVQDSFNSLDHNFQGDERIREAIAISPMEAGMKGVQKSGFIKASDIEKQALQIEKIGETELPWWTDRSLVKSLIVTSWMLSIGQYNEELAPIFVSAPASQGGLNISLDTFAFPLALTGIVLTFYALFGYPALQNWAGLKLTCSIGLLAAVPGDLLLPVSYYWRTVPVMRTANIFLALSITKITIQTAFTSSMVIINSIAPRSQLGTVNGFRMMVAATGRSAGPVVGGYLWGVSATLKFPGQHFLGFLLASCSLVGCWALHHSIPLEIPQ